MLTQNPRNKISESLCSQLTTPILKVYPGHVVSSSNTQPFTERVLGLFCGEGGEE